MPNSRLQIVVPRTKVDYDRILSASRPPVHLIPTQVSHLQIRLQQNTGIHNEPIMGEKCNGNGGKHIWKEHIQDCPSGYFAHTGVLIILCLSVRPTASTCVHSSVCSITHIQLHAKNPTVVPLCVHRVTDGKPEWRTHLKILSGACSPVTRS